MTRHALVVDAGTAARRRTAGLLHLCGWQVHEAAAVGQALALSAAVELDLVVLTAGPGAGGGPELITRFRRAGSTARFLVVAAGATAADRAGYRAAGALACLTGPLDAGLLLDLVERRGAGPGAGSGAGAFPLVDRDDLHDADLDAELVDRLQEMYDDALPGRLTAIATGARRGDPAAVAAAAQTLAGPSGQLGHPQVADLCRAIAADARRGVLAHHLVADLTTAARPAPTGRPPLRLVRSTGS